ncbi:MAG: DUF423 domain-containing protein [Kiloniellaceae bacterium]
MRLWISAAAVNGFLAVAMGAFAAHGLAGRLAPEALDWIETAARYQAIHGLALLGVAALAGRAQGRPFALRLAGWGFLLGTVLFCGALYLMGLSGWRAPGAVVPFGGVAFLAGWAALLAYGLGSRRGVEGRWPT